MLRRALFFVVTTWAISACAPQSAMLRPYAVPPEPDAAQTLAQLSKVRDLPLDSPVETERLGDEGFLAAYHAMLGTQSRKGSHAGVFWSAFTMSTAPAEVSSMAQRMMDDGLDGFYDPHAKRLYVRARAKPEPSDAARLTVAHEEEHALQDRFFGMPDLNTIVDVDQGLALRALFEGDATVASVVLDEVRKGGTSAETLARIARMGEDDDRLVLRASGLRAPTGAPELLRAELAWPYVRGSQLVARLAASGGWALVNAAMRSPPKTTEQVLHVEKYIAGEGAIEVRAPAAPPGYTLVEIGRMGELRTRFLLAQCLKDGDAADGASGWGGDAYAIAARGSEHALVWSTAWDDEKAATRFAAALEARAVCPRTGPKPPFKVVQSGARVAFVQGLEDDDVRTKEGATLLALVGKTPPSVPPLGRVRLETRPAVASDFEHGGVAGGGRFVDAPIGLSSDLANLRPVHSDYFELEAAGEFVTVYAAVAWAPPSVALGDELVAAFVKGVRSKNAAEPIFDQGTTNVQLEWTRADARTLRVANRTTELVLAPACEGKMTVVLVSTWQPGTFGAATAGAWLRSVKVAEEAPACRALKTLRDPGGGAKL